MKLRAMAALQFVHCSASPTYRYQSSEFLHRPATRLSSCPADLEGMRLPGTRIQAALRDF
jgi:hypothetical protein